MPRTQQEFDKWFAESGGDPWHYDSPFVTDRLQRSLIFIKRHLSPRFRGLFVEIGAFNGAFSARLAPAFPRSIIIANDISGIAIQQAREATCKFKNVVFDQSDMMSFRMPEMTPRRDSALLLMETLYYLPQDERPEAIRHLIATVRPKTIFVSGPIQGDKYFNEKALIEQFRAESFTLKGISVLNTTDEFRALPPKKQSHRMLKRPNFRQKYGRQVMYCFRPSLWSRIRTRLEKTERAPPEPRTGRAANRRDSRP